MYQYSRRYVGPVEAVILDLAGTCVDFGSLAPIRAFQQLFQEHGVPISESEARAPMGTEKREHIRQLLAMPRIAAEWTAQHGAADEAVIDRLYHAFEPIQIAAIGQRSQLIPGLLEAQEYCQQQDIKIGVNSGYSRSMLNAMLPALTEQGFVPASVVCATEVPNGRPYPHMSLKGMLELAIGNVQACVKVDDTLTGLEEGLAAGMWTVGVAVSGNEIGLDQEQWDSLPEDEQLRRSAAARQRMLRCGAHYAIDSVAELPGVLADIEHRLLCGEQP